MSVLLPSKNILHTVILTKGKLSYTTARETMLFDLEISGLDKKQFGLHSLRSGDNCRSR
jgi:hypothetical protein